MTLTTPLLIPSVSSPGFPLDQDGIAESSLFLQYALDSLDEALLVSAYDVEHRRLRDADALLRGDAAGTVFDRPRLLVIDSGGYETGQSWESGHVERSDTTAAPYDAATFARVVDRLPAERPTLVVSYDEPRQGYGEQIRRGVLRATDSLASDILRKPPSGRWHTPRDRSTPPRAPTAIGC